VGESKRPRAVGQDDDEIDIKMFCWMWRCAFFSDERNGWTDHPTNLKLERIQCT
jgi:hypothetical protein